MKEKWEILQFDLPFEQEDFLEEEAYVLKKQDSAVKKKKPKGKRIISGWWGKAWCANLEQYSDTPRAWTQGKQMARAGRVRNLRIQKGAITARVQGNEDEPYSVKIKVRPLTVKESMKLLQRCENRPSTRKELLAGDLSEELKKILQSREGIFPAARDLEFSCNCTRTFRMCSHVIATLYGVGMALDKDANRLFTLRGIGAENFLDQIERKKAERMLLRSRQKTKRAVDPEEVREFFPQDGAFWE